MNNLIYTKFSEIDVNDNFFDSLRSDYEEFPQWFDKKARSGEKAYVYSDGNLLQGFLYLKVEHGVIADVEPNIPAGKHLKIGTMKINAHGTKLGQRFIKKIFDHAIADGVDDVYVTAFSKHVFLIDLLKKYGFEEFAIKNGLNGEETVLLKTFSRTQNDILLDYPKISKQKVTCALLAIYPEYHTKFLPDSKLANESFDIVEDVSHANSIHKIYLSGVAATGKLNRGDILVMYRTTDIPGKAYYRSVATSIGVVEETRKISSFENEQEFITYVSPFSVFPEAELRELFSNKRRHVVIKFTYNIALRKRIIRKHLLEDIGLPSGGRRWDFLRLSPTQFNDIVSIGQVNESYFID